MSKREKLLDSIKNALNNVTFSQIRKLLENFGFTLDRVAGSHHIFRREDVIFPIPVHNKRVKIVYVKRVIEIIEKDGDS